MTSQADPAAGAAPREAAAGAAGQVRRGRQPDGPARPRSGQPGGQPPGSGFGRAAVLIGALTVAARCVGFGRQLVFTHTVGFSCLGTAYSTANQVPNIIYDVVLGGALASVLVPLLAGPALRAGDDPGQARFTSRVSSALLTWSVIILAPVSLLVAVLAGRLAAVLVPFSARPGCPHPEMITVASRMLAVFAPQVMLYGLAVVLFGILQAHRRFTAPALAPMLSSLVVIGAYLAFVPFGRGLVNHIAALPVAAQLILSAGTTAGVAALVLSGLVPALRLRPRLRLRPALRFPPGVAARAGGLAAVGVAALVAQDLAAIVVIRLANGYGTRGALVLYGSAWQAFLVPYAVLAVPIAISAFPGLATGRGAEFDQTAAASARAMLLASGLGAGLLAAAALPLAGLFVSHDPAQAHQLATAQAHQLAVAFAAFAPGLIGFGLIASQSRVLLAAGRNLTAGIWMSAGWLLAIAADVPLVRLVPADWVVPALGLGNTAGLTVAAAGLAIATRRVRGGAALAGTIRAAAAGLAGAVAGAAAGAASVAAVRPSGLLLNAALGVLACTCGAAAFGGVVWLVDRDDLRAATGVARRLLTWR